MLPATRLSVSSQVIAEVVTLHTMMATFRVLLFASAREAAGGADAISVDVAAGSNGSEAPLCEVVSAAMRLHPGLERLGGVMAVAVNQEYAAADSRQGVKPSDEIAIIPPISGG